ncbi:unnamed protein product, partial [marine sediment metagenome]
SKKHISKEYSLETKIGRITVKKRVLPCTIVREIGGENSFIIPILSELEDRITLKYSLKTFDPAPIGEWPLWYLDRRLKRSSRIQLIYSPKSATKSHDHFDKSLLTENKCKRKTNDFLSVEKEYGICLSLFSSLNILLDKLYEYLKSSSNILFIIESPIS